VSEKRGRTTAAPVPRTLIADPSEGLRGWLSAGAGRSAGLVTAVSHAWEVLWHLAHEHCDLVITGPQLRDVPPVQLLAMVRTTGLTTPFVLLLPWSSSSMIQQVNRLAPVEIVDDWSDGHSLRRASERLLGSSPPPDTRLHARREKLLRIARQVVTRKLPV